MNEYSVEIESNTYFLDIFSTNYETNDITHHEASVDINGNNEYIITLESSIINNVDNLEIIKYNDYELTLTNTVYANLPDEIPMSIITGNLDVSRIDGLDDYLTTIPIDGGSP